MLELSISNRVATLTLQRPPVNALSEEWGEAFEKQLDALAARSDWTVLHLRSTQKVFAAGADLAQINAWAQEAAPGRRLAAYIARLQRAFQRLEELPFVTLAEIGGHALGGGLELALSCDLRIAAPDVKLGLPEVGLGLIPGLGGTQRLTRLVGAGVASRMILCAEVVDGETAERLGLVQWVVPRDTLSRTASELAVKVAALPRPALGVAKELIAAAAPQGRMGFAMERVAGGHLLDTVEARERVSGFLQKTNRKS